MSLVYRRVNCTLLRCMMYQYLFPGVILEVLLLFNLSQIAYVTNKRWQHTNSNFKVQQLILIGIYWP